MLILISIFEFILLLFGISLPIAKIDEFWFFSKCPSECQGLNHMSGNVWEWVLNENPDNFINNQIAKGGSWRSPKQELRVWSRKYLDPSATGDHVGFRCSK